MVRASAILVAFCLLIASPRALSAQESPEAFARRFADVAKRGDWQTYSQMMHPDALAALKKIFAEALSGATSGETVRKVFGVSNATEFEALPDALVFVRLFTILEKNVEWKALLSTNLEGLARQIANARMIAPPK